MVHLFRITFQSFKQNSYNRKVWTGEETWNHSPRIFSRGEINLTKSSDNWISMNNRKHTNCHFPSVLWFLWKLPIISNWRCGEYCFNGLQVQQLDCKSNLGISDTVRRSRLTMIGGGRQRNIEPRSAKGFNVVHANAKSPVWTFALITS